MNYTDYSLDAYCEHCGVKSSEPRDYTVNCSRCGEEISNDEIANVRLWDNGDEEVSCKGCWK